MPKEDTLTNSLAIVGNEDLVLGFRALGFKVYPAQNKEQVEEALAESANQGCAVCLVQEELYSLAKESIDSFRDSPSPIFIPFAKDYRTELLDRIVRDIRLRATGKF
jgi:V/A-type H+-transporting ATPase subunit F